MRARACSCAGMNEACAMRRWRWRKQSAITRGDAMTRRSRAQSRTVSDQLLCLTLSLVSLTALTVAPLRCQTYARTCCVRALC